MTIVVPEPVPAGPVVIPNQDVSTVVVPDQNVSTVVVPAPGGPSSPVLVSPGPKESVTIIEEGGRGEPGPPGPPGPPGKPGSDGAPGEDLHYVHFQGIGSKVWTVLHMLGKHPEVSAEDGAGTLIFGTVRHLSNDVLTIEFAVTLTGRANCT